MTTSLRSHLCGSIGLLSAAIALTTSITPALANPSGFNGSYVGVTVDGNNAGASLESLMKTSNGLLWAVDQTLGEVETDLGDRQFQGRLDIPNAPLSMRTTVVVNQDVRAVLPTLSYDVAVADGANIYAGAGYAIVREGETATPVGDRNGVVITTGAEAAIGSNLVIYGDVRFRPTAQPSTNENLRMQVGIGRRF